MSWAFAELLGMRATSMGDGRARFELDVAPSHLATGTFYIQAARAAE